MTLSLFFKTSLLFIAFLFNNSLFAISIDTLPTFPTMSPGNKWIELGIGGTFGKFSSTRYSPQLRMSIREKLKIRSIGFDGSYNWGKKQGRFAVGIKGSFGSVAVSEKVDIYSGFNFAATGFYFAAEGRLFGFKYGLLFVEHDDPRYVYNRKNRYPIVNIRVGKSRSYYIDIRAYDEFGMGLFPEPEYSIGFFNYGFKDKSGMRKIRVAIAAIDYGTAISLGLRHPIGQSPLLFDGVMHLYLNDIIASLGIRYRFDMSWK